MISDVQATRLDASGSIFGGAARVKAISIIPGGTAGSVVIKDGGSGGTTICTIDTPASATDPMFITIPGAGLRCADSAYATLTNITAVTVFYG